MLLLPACVIKTFKEGKPSTSFCGAQVVNLMFAAAMDSKLMFSADSPTVTTHPHLSDWHYSDVASLPWAAYHALARLGRSMPAW